MSRGAIFARGSCRALKWMALFGVVFVLGAGSGAAQAVTGTVTVEAPSGVTTVKEGESVTLAVEATLTIPDGTAAGTVVITPSMAGGSASGTVTAGETADSVGFEPAVLTLHFPTVPSGEAHAEVTRTATIAWKTAHDPDIDDEAAVLSFPITGTLTGLDAPDPINLTIKDDDRAEFTWNTAAPTLKENESVTVALTAEHTITTDSTATVNFHVNLPGYTVVVGGSGNSHTFDTDVANRTASVVITAPTNDGNRETDTLLLTVLKDAGGPPLIEALPITVEDINKLPTVTAKITDEDGDEVMSVAEGEKVTLQFEVEEDVDEDVTITLSLASSSEATADDYSLSATKATIDDGDDMSKELTLTAALNADVTDEMLVLTGKVTGEDNVYGEPKTTPFTVALTIEDMTQRQIFVLTADTDPPGDAMGAIYDAMNAAKGSDGELNPGANFQVAKSDLFGTAMGFEPRVSASSSASAVSVDDDGTHIMVTAVSEGTATITVTGSAIPMGSNFRANQISASVADIEFAVMVEPAPAAVVRGQITKFELTGAVEERRIGGVTRLFVAEGEQNLTLEVTVRWTNEEILQIGTTELSGSV